MTPQSPRWDSSLLPGSSMAWTAATLAGWQMAASATLWFTRIPTVGPRSLGSEALASLTHRAACTVFTATASTRRGALPCRILSLAVYLLSGLFSFVGWSHFNCFYTSQFKFSLNTFLLFFL